MYDCVLRLACRSVHLSVYLIGLPDLCGRKVRPFAPSCLCDFRGSSPVLCTKQKSANVLPPSPIISQGRGAGGEGGHGDSGLRRFGAGGVAGMCGERACSMCVRAGLWAVRSRLAGRMSGAAGRLRTGVCTLWCPLAQQFRTPRYILVHLAQAGSPCWRHVTDRGSLSTYPGR